MTPEMGRYTLQDDKARMAAHIADLDAHTRNIFETLRVGEYYSGITGVNTSLTLVADRLYAFPFVVARDITIDRIAIDVAAPGAGGTTARLGIYNNGVNLAPGALLLDAGQVAVDGVAIVAATIDQALPKGIYWLALVSDGVPLVDAGLYLTLPFSLLGINPGLFSSVRTGWRVAHAYAPLPDPYGVGVVASDERAVIGVRVASLD